MAGSIVINILGNASNFIGATNQAGGALDKWGARAGKAGLAITAALAGAAKVSVKAAADQSAAVSAWTQVTGKQMDQQQKTIARSLNLSQTDYAKSYTTLSSLYQSNGLAQKKANEMAAKGLKLAADQAAFGNSTVADAVEAQAGLLKGSGELLEKYAISITAADVAARMKKDGTDKLTGSELKAASAMAKSNLIAEQSAKFLGQAARESNSLESRQQKLSATIEDFKAKLGANLLPVVEQFVGKLQELAEWVQNNEGKAKTLAVGLGILAGVLLTTSVVLKAVATAQKVAAAATMLFNGAMWLLSAAMWANPAVLIAGSIIALGAAFVIAYKKSETFRDIVNKVFDAVKKVVITAIQILADIILGFWGMVINGAAKAFGWVPGLGKKLKGAAAAFNEFKDDVNRSLENIKNPTIHIGVEIDNVAKKLADAGVPQAARNAKNRVVSLAGRAIGGPVTQGTPYWVGEKGPEIFVPGAGGSIVPNHRVGNPSGGGSALGGSAGGPVMLEVVFSGDSEDMFVKALRKAIRVRGGNVQAVLGA